LEASAISSELRRRDMAEPPVNVRPAHIQPPAQHPPRPLRPQRETARPRPEGQPVEPGAERQPHGEGGQQPTEQGKDAPAKVEEAPAKHQNGSDGRRPAGDKGSRDNDAEGGCTCSVA
jgi:hypothetical protein